MPPDADEADMPPPRVFHFGSFNVTSQVFHTTPYSFCLVNLKPLLPGHILVSPIRRIPHLADLTPAEISDLFNTVVRVQKTLKRLYRAEAFNVAVQDGVAAGQTVSHVHCHVIPRAKGDAAEEGDKIHEWLEGDEGDVGKALREAERREWPKDEERKPRDMGVMEREAEWLRTEMGKDEEEGAGGKL